jgi:hypothetical protein
VRKVREIFPRASDGFVELNEDKFNCEPPGANPQSGVCHGSLEKGEIKEADTRKRKVSIVSYRSRLADVDALCGKWHLDALRMFGVIKDDTAKDITYQISQKKVKTKKEEKTLIEITIP